MNRLVYFLAALALAAAGCSNLPDIADGVCGNKVLEPGEDCDGFADPELGANTKCAAAGEANECSYVCDAASDSACPDGWGCGTDGECRHAAGVLEPAPGSPWRFKVTDFDIGDVDGDGNADLIGAGDARISVRYGTSSGEFPVDLDVTTRRTQGPPQFVDIDEDGLLDVVMPIFSGIFVMLGQADRTLAPVAYQPIAVGIEGLDVSQVDLLPLSANPEDLNSQLLAMIGTEQFFLTDGGEGSKVTFPGGNTVADIAGRVPVGDVDVLSLLPRQEWVLAFKGDDRVFMYSSAGLGVALRPNERQEVLLPAGTTVKFGAYFGNVDGDTVLGVGSTDLLVSVTDGANDFIAVAYNDGAGNLDATAGIEVVFDALTPEVRPLLVGDLNGDLRADYVSGDGIMLTDFALIPTSGQPPRSLIATAVRTSELPWADAAAGDFNADGRADVAVSVQSQDGLDFYLGSGFLFNKFHVNTDDPPFALHVADHDGDFVDDLAFGLSGLGSKPDGLAVAFGATSGGPSDPIFMGEFSFIKRIDPIQFIADIEALDLIADLLVVAATYPDREALSIAILQGSSDRRLLSPFALNVSEEDGGGTDIPQRVVVGNFAQLLSTDDPLDIAAVAQPPENFGGADTETAGATGPTPGDLARTFRMWLVPGDGPEAQLSGLEAVYTEMPEERDFETRCAHWTAGDLDGDGTDEIIGIDGAFRCYGNGFTPDPRVVVAASTAGDPDVTAFDLPGDFTSSAGATAIDLDADGDDDLLLLFRGEVRADAEGVEGPAEGSGVLVVWNVDGALKFSTTASLQIPEAFSVFDVAAMKLTGDDLVPELVVLADGAIYVATLDTETAQYGAAEVLLEQNGHGRIASGDVNGDGLDDLAWIEGSDAHVFLGVAAPPVGGAVGDAVPAEEEGGE